MGRMYGQASFTLGTENIRNAESTIRDVDIAKEIMEYIKNNILVQSAQTNQHLQGVLQMLG